MTEKKPGPLSRYRDHYRTTKAEHRPLPVLYPFAAIIFLVIIALLFLDNLAADMHGHWPGWLAEPAAAVTDFGRSWWILTLASLVIIAAWAARQLMRSESGRRVTAGAISIAFYILASVGLAALLANIIKRAVGRPRPAMFNDHGLFSFNPFTWNFDFESFPSGHATVNGAFFMALALLFPRYRWPLLVVGLCLALTRVLIGVHYPSDVTAGFGFGMWFAFATAVWFSRFGLLFRTEGSALRLRV